MPELPDLQVFSRNLLKRISGKKIRKLHAPDTGKLNVPVAKLRKALEGQEVENIYREGKEIHISFRNGEVLGLHMMLHGDLTLFEGKNENRHTIMAMTFDDDTGLALTDWQRMATPTLNPEPRDAPDALSDSITEKFLFEKLQKTRTTIKNLLLDQHVIRGIGNAYADEILWDARISPFSVCSKIPKNKIKPLRKSIRKVLINAEKLILKHHPDIIKGEVRDFLLIHNPKKTKSPTGAVIQHEVIGSRKSYFTDEQVLYK